MDRLETRELEYFVAVAEACHFGRAAERLGIAQPPLSRAISRLERRLGVTLLARTSRRVGLTPAGETLLREARAVLDALDAAAGRTVRAATTEPGLTVAVKPGSDGGLLRPILDAYRERPGAVEVDLCTCTAGEQPGLLRTGAADVAFLHGHQADPTHFDHEVLVEEHQVAVLPADHLLAGKPEVFLADLGDQLLSSEQVAADPARAIQLVALGRAAVVLPASSQGLLRSDVICRPVLDAPRASLLLAWPVEHTSPALAAFVRTAVDVAQSR